MPDELTNAQIALLCEIGEQRRPGLVGHATVDIEYLLVAGFVERTSRPDGSVLKLTAKGINFLGSRGAGLNEA